MLEPRHKVGLGALIVAVAGGLAAFMNWAIDTDKRLSSGHEGRHRLAEADSILFELHSNDSVQIARIQKRLGMKPGVRTTPYRPLPRPPEHVGFLKKLRDFFW